MEGAVESLGLELGQMLAPNVMAAASVVNDMAAAIQALTPEQKQLAVEIGATIMGFTAFLLVKSTNHFHAGFQPVSSEIVYIAAPTSYPTDPATTAYRKARLDLWPRVADPLGLEG